ncbi:hypothetical protein EIP86_009871 [Pleurotus ostreatoroseus]|nr:hypothetical protein EIP86_009871 [Pleurotus ostreatoroseus]
MRGETKTWYSVPGEDADKFEAAIRREAPGLFEAQPNLLFPLITLMNPQRVKEAGVEVYSCNQRAGEFVITFSKAYHAGFNHGVSLLNSYESIIWFITMMDSRHQLNFNEAVNFALPDWLYGLDYVKCYQEHRKLPVFSHNELIITIRQQSTSIKTVKAMPPFTRLNESLQEMVDRELEARTRARKMEMEETLEESDGPEEQSQRTLCRRVLRKRFDDTGLLDTQIKVTERANVPFSWRGKLDRLLSETAWLPLKSLRNLLVEGDCISFPLRELHSLRKCVVRANEWVGQAATFRVRKTPRKRPVRRVRGRVAGVEGAVIEDVEKLDHSMRDLHALVWEVEDLGFDCQEIAALRQLASDAENTQAKARALLQAASSLKGQARDTYIQECERLIAHGTSLNVLVDELTEVEKIVMREQLLKELDEETNYEQLTLEDVRQLFSRAHMCGLSLESTHSHMKLFEMRPKAGGRAKAVLEKGQRTLEELEEAAVVSPETRGKEIEKQLTIWLHPDSTFTAPRPSDVIKLVQRGEKEYSLQTVKEMRCTVDFAVDLENRIGVEEPVSAQRGQ